MPTDHTIEEKQNLAKIARQYGVLEERILRAPENREYFQRYPDANILAPGETITVPDPEPVQFSVPTGMTTTFVLKKKYFVFELLLAIGDDLDEEILADTRFKFEVGGFQEEGKTTPYGVARLTVPQDEEETEGTLHLFLDEEGDEPDFEFDVSLHALNPVNSTTGAQARLNHLGYECGAIDGDVAEKTEAMLEAFGTHHGMEETSVEDEALQDAITQRHSC